jgi:hypothetical protein
MIIFLLVLSVSSQRVQADGDVEDVLRDGFYGGLVGALVGGAVLLLTDNPEDHLDYLAYGAATGILLGTAYGVVQLSRRAVAEIDHGRLTWHIPSVGVDWGDQTTRRGALWGEQRFKGLRTERVGIDFIKVSF